MTIYSFWIFDRHCNCIYNREYSQLDQTSSTTGHKGTVNSKDNEDTAKLLFGALFSLRNIARTLGDNTTESGKFNNELQSFTTGKYRAHFYESLSNLRFCLLSDLKTRDLRGLLKLLNEVFVEFIVRNPMASVEFQEGEVIEDNLFVKKVDDVIDSFAL